MWTSDRQSSTLSTDVLARFANFKLAGDRAVRDVSETIANVSAAAAASSSNAAGSFAARGAVLHARGGVGRRGRRRRPRYGGGTRRSSNRRVSGLTDAELEAELAARKAQRARERDRYARSMRSDKLQVLEMELHRLRTKIGGGTPANPRWESLGADGRGRAPSLNASVRREPPGTPMPGGGPGGPPPPPPITGLRDPGEEEEIDPEKQKREKAERQRRREQKRKEREANKKPMTLADIIRSAGKNPIARLKPKGSTATEDVNEPKEEISEMVTVTLKKVEKVEDKVEVVEESELSVALKKAAKGVEEGESKEEVGEEEAGKSEGKDETGDGKNVEPKSDVSPAPEKEDGKPEEDIATEETPNGVVGEGEVVPEKKPDANPTATTAEPASSSPAPPPPPPVVAPAPVVAEIEPVEAEKANGGIEADLKPQLEDVLSKLAVKKVLKDTVPSEKNIDQSPDKHRNVAPAATTEVNKDDAVPPPPPPVAPKKTDKPKLDSLLKSLAKKKKKSA